MNTRGSYEFHILIKLPLNVLWRLIGLDKEYNTIFESELFWKIKCERELGVLHDPSFIVGGNDTTSNEQPINPHLFTQRSCIGSYRAYYLLRSENGYGPLWMEGVAIPGFDRVKRIIRLRKYINNECYILNDHTLYNFNLLNMTRTIVMEGVSDIDSVGVNDDELLITKDDKTQYHRHMPRNSGGIFGGRPPYDLTLLKVGDPIKRLFFVKDEHSSTYTILTTTGRLLDGTLDDYTEITNNIVDIMVQDHEWENYGLLDFVLIDKEGFRLEGSIAQPFTSVSSSKYLKIERDIDSRDRKLIYYPLHCRQEFINVRREHTDTSSLYIRFYCDGSAQLSIQGNLVVDAKLRYYGVLDQVGGLIIATGYR